jgi:oligopeptide transport system substrate-binding protein
MKVFPISFLRPLATLAALVFMTGCGNRETQIQIAAKAGIMLVGNGAEPSDLDPQTITGIPERNITAAMFEGLTRNDPKTLEAIPGQAKSWDVSEDGLVYTFHLREGLTWSDGVPLTAQDFYASFRRMLSGSLGSDNSDQLYDIVNAEEYHKGKLQDFSQVGFRVIDDLTLEVRLKHPATFLLKTMGSRSWVPVPMHVLEKFGDPLLPGSPWTRPDSLVCNGPFKLKEWKPNSYIELERNHRYWNDKTVKLNGIRFFPIDNQPAEEAAFRSGQLHKTERVPLTKIAVYRREAPEKLHIHPYSGVYYYNFNVNKPPFTDVRVRRALAMAVNRESLVKNVTLAGEIPAYHFTPEGISGYVSKARTKLDFDEARRLLAEAGYPGGEGMPPITLLYNTAENHRVIAEAIQQTWKHELGIDIQLENQEWKVYLDNMQHEFYQICRAGLIMDPYDPSQFLRVFTSDNGFNRTGWKNDEYDRLYKEVMATADQAKRMELMQEMEKILTDAMPILPIYYYTNQYLMDPSVKGWENNLLSQAPFEQVWLD